MSKLKGMFSTKDIDDFIADSTKKIKDVFIIIFEYFIIIIYIISNQSINKFYREYLIRFYLLSQI